MGIFNFRKLRNLSNKTKFDITNISLLTSAVYSTYVMHNYVNLSSF